MPLLLLIALIPWTPPPAKNAAAQWAPIIKPADPFDNINLMTPERMRGEATVPSLVSVRGY